MLVLEYEDDGVLIVNQFERSVVEPVSPHPVELIEMRVLLFSETTRLRATNCCSGRARSRDTAGRREI